MGGILSKLGYMSYPVNAFIPRSVHLTADDEKVYCDDILCDCRVVGGQDPVVYEDRRQELLTHWTSFNKLLWNEATVVIFAASKLDKYRVPGTRDSTTKLYRAARNHFMPTSDSPTHPTSMEEIQNFMKLIIVAECFTGFVDGYEIDKAASVDKAEKLEALLKEQGGKVGCLLEFQEGYLEQQAEDAKEALKAKQEKDAVAQDKWLRLITGGKGMKKDKGKSKSNDKENAEE